MTWGFAQLVKYESIGHYIAILHNVPIGRIVYRCTEYLHCSSMEEGRKQASEVSSNSAEWQSKVHTLTQKWIQAAANSTLQVILQSLQKLLDLRNDEIKLP